MYTPRSPAQPEVPDDQRATATGSLRYEDIAQDGRLMLHVLPHFAGRAIWQTALARFPAARAAAHLGIIPILSRFDLTGTAATLTIRKPLTVSGSFQLAHTADAAGQVNRIVLNMWCEIRGPQGHMMGGSQAGDGEEVSVGRVYAEHVFTRLFAPPEQRKVLRVELPDLADFPPVPPVRHVWRPQDEVLELPPGAVALDELTVESTTTFGLTHTDSNQHVNSLVYPRLFEEAAIRRFAALGRSPRVLARSAEITYRKPGFAGDRVEILVRAFELDGRLGAVGGFVPVGGATGAKPNCMLRLVFGA